MIDLIREPAQARRRDGDRVIVAPMRASDVPDIIQLEKRCYSLPWTPGAYVTEIGNPSAGYLIAKRGNGDLIGYGGVWVIMDEMHVTTLAVDPPSRGQKIGERLLINLMYEGMKRGALRATLEVRQHNRAAHGLYLKYGFNDVAVRKHYYSDNGENAIIMWAEEITSPRYLRFLDNNLRRVELLHGEAPRQ